MTIPTAVSPSVKVPGTYLTLNLLGGLISPGAGALRIIVLAPKNAADGDITPDTEIRQIFSDDEASISHGVGGQGHLTVQRVYEEFPTADVFVGAPTASTGVAATVDLSIAGTVTENSVVRTVIKGVTIDVAWNSGEDDATFRTRLISAIGGVTDFVPMSAAAGVPAGETILTAKQAGLWGDDIIVSTPVFVLGGGGGTIGANVLSAGTLEPDYSTILDLIKNTEYTVITGALSNADVTLTGATSNGDRIKVHIETFNSGLNALLQTAVTGHTGAIADVQAGAIDRNFEFMWIPYGKNWQSLPCELAGAEAGQSMKFVSQRANFNRIGLTYIGLFGPANEEADKLSETQMQSLLTNGVSPLNLEEGTNDPFLVRPVTTHSQFAGNPDDRAFDMTDTFGSIIVARDLRSAIPAEFANASITEDLPEGDNELPAGVVERKDVQSFVESRLSEIWVPAGVVDGNLLAEAIANGQLVVEINATDPTQVDIFVPLAIIKPLAKFGITVSKVA